MMPRSLPDLSRDHPDPHVADAPALAIDRRRIVQSSAFRRLQYKTQVFVAMSGDHFRTRLTHTLEVSILARSLAHSLELNCDLAEVVALAHDLGHAPFGHAGERALNACMQSAGGFEHNAQSLRVVEYLEHPYPPFRGLNLTRAVRDCLKTHETRYDRPHSQSSVNGSETAIEGRVAALSDQFAYSLHDLQDGLFAGLFDPAGLMELDLWRRFYDGPQPSDDLGWRGHVRSALDRIQQHLLDDVSAQFRADPTRSGLALSERTQADFDELCSFLFERMYRSARLRASDEEATRLITRLFDAYSERIDELPGRYTQRIELQGVQRVVADYIAGMTDHYCAEESRRLAP